jgi:hypothetical protein
LERALAILLAIITRGNMDLTSEIGGAPPMYLSFLLRLWRETEQGGWRASLENVMTGERHGFPDLPSLYAFLQAACQEPATQGREDRVSIGIPAKSSDAQPA